MSWKDMKYKHIWNDLAYKVLTHGGQDKKAAMLQTTFWNAILLTANCILIQISPKFVCKGPIHKKASLLQIVS